MRSSISSQTNPLLDQIKDFFDTQSSRTDEPEICAVCGELQRFVHATFWLDGTALKWDLHFPVCSCNSAVADREEASTIH